ncbi:MAG: alpha-amylase [Muribaculaceae bacterium]|nr:alpha-amylase [Muribaculaceae bacterium]
MKKFALLSLAALLAVAPTAFAQGKDGKQPEFGSQKTTVQHPDWVSNATIYEANLRQGSETRNLKGMQQHLPRLKDLGVDIIWHMPIHPISQLNKKGELGSYYAVQDYKKVNPEFGNMLDLQEFVRTAHDLGMYVILDEVCNHTGCDNAWVKEHPEYYKRDKEGNFVSPYDWTDTYQLDYSNPELRAAMKDALKFWVQEADIDGYRCDVAGMVPVDFWNEARKELDEIKPVFMLAEATSPELTLNAFDADYNWPMKDLFHAIAATQGVNQYAIDHKQSLPKKCAKDIIRLYEQQRKEYPQGAINMNMVTNHDLNSWEGTEMERYGQGLAAFASLSYLLPGMPMMYTGQEVGMDHALEFFKYDQVPDYTANDYTAFYEMLNALKKNHQALDATNPESEFRAIPMGNDNIIAFERKTPSDVVVYIANLSDKEADYKADKSLNIKNMTEYFTGAKKLPKKLGPWDFFIFTK